MSTRQKIRQILYVACFLITMTSLLYGQSNETVPFIRQYPCTVMVMPELIPFTPLDSVFTCSLFIKNLDPINGGLAGMAYHLFFDPTVFEIVGFGIGSIWPSNTSLLIGNDSIEWNVSGCVKDLTIGTMGGGGPTSGDGALAYITIRPRGLGSCSLSVRPPSWPRWGLWDDGLYELPCEILGAIYNNP